MTPQEMTKKLTVMEKAVLKQRDNDAQTKYQCIAMFKYIKKLIAYQIPKPPIDVSEDGHEFRCPTCRTIFDSEDHVDDFYLCYICGQRWKEAPKDED